MGAGGSVQKPHESCSAAYLAEDAGMADAAVAMDPASASDPSPRSIADDLRTAEVVKPVEAALHGASPPFLYVPGSGALGIGSMPENAGYFDPPRQPTPRPIARKPCSSSSGACEDLFAGWEREDQHSRATQDATNAS